jgi:mRNA-degrading endonuclease RelE of RelBE toxin-antitoxin system
VTYRVRFEAYALVQLLRLPSEAFDALLDRVVELVEAPWDAVVMRPATRVGRVLLV